MKGVIQTGFGDPGDVLSIGEVETPAVADDGVLVRVRAASIHIGAVYGVRGLPKVMRPMFKSFIANSGVIGQNIAGIVEAVGPDVTHVAVGDEVFGSCKGAFAEYAVTTSEALASKPTNLTFEQASAVGVSAFTALQALRSHGNLQEGQHVLVTGASGGVGTFAVQIAKAMGAEVTGVCSNRNLDLVRSIGADHVIDYTQHDFTKGKPEYDLILDNVGAHSLKDMRRVLTADGLLLANGAPAPTGWFGGLGHPLKATVSSMFSKQQGRPFFSTENEEDLRVLHDLAETGKITPVIDHVFPLEAAIEAVTSVGEGHNQGTSVITMRE
jgi:NADPH:quinone reductase-like Zn-dependent oxidoreductase